MKIKNMLTSENLEADLSRGSLEIFKLNYIGEFHRSENGRFILSWSDTDPEGICGGAREKGHGRYILIDGDKIVLQGELERPNDGKVSDQGIFVLNDWMFKGELIGTFYAFEPNGQKLIQHKFNANLCNNGISRDGQFAVCQTYASENEDGNKLSFFNLGKRELIWKLEPEPGLAEKYSFDTEKEILCLFYENYRTYRYSFDGNFLGPEKCEKEQSAASSGLVGDFLDSEEREKEPSKSYGGYETFDIAIRKREELESKIADPSSYNEFISLMEKALNQGVSEYYQAIIHRELGEVYQKLGMRAEAIRYFEKAISLNPKIGVKKILKRLKEELSRG